MGHSDGSRTHDSFYAQKSDGADNVKESFRFAADIISDFKTQSGLKKIKLLDAGCAAGDFLSYVSSQSPKDQVTGLEILPELLLAGKSKYPGLEFIQGSVLDEKVITPSSFEVITLMGVLGIFSDAEPVLRNLSSWIRPGGMVLIHGLFNPWDVDVFVSYRNREVHGTTHREVGWNIFSQTGIRETLFGLGAKNVKFYEFKIGVDIERNSVDPVRSWTEKLADGSRQITNGLGLKQPHFFCEATF
jgi:SAM-dependent methyltransferase